MHYRYYIITKYLLLNIKNCRDFVNVNCVRKVVPRLALFSDVCSSCV